MCTCNSRSHLSTITGNGTGVDVLAGLTVQRTTVLQSSWWCATLTIEVVIHAGQWAELEGRPDRMRRIELRQYEMRRHRATNWPIAREGMTTCALRFFYTWSNLHKAHGYHYVMRL